jgi:hypothetical protein
MLFCMCFDWFRKLRLFVNVRNRKIDIVLKALIHHYVLKFVCDLRQVGVFLQVLRFPPPIKLTATIFPLCGKWSYHSQFELSSLVFHIVIDVRISTIDHLICIESSERKLILVTTDLDILLRCLITSKNGHLYFKE